MSEYINFSRPCPFCAGRATLTIHQPKFGLPGAWMECGTCKARGPWVRIWETKITETSLSTPITPQSIARGARIAISAWNTRSGPERKHHDNS